MMRDHGTWEVSARRNGREQIAGVFHHTSPRGAVFELMGALCTRFKFDDSYDWDEWVFVCKPREANTAPPVVLAIDQWGLPVRRIAAVPSERNA
jgi:hypothetical protein